MWLLLYWRRTLAVTLPLGTLIIGWLSLASLTSASAATSGSQTLNIISIFLGHSGYSRSFASTRDANVDKVAPDVRADLTGGHRVSTVILLAEQADLSNASEIRDPNERGWYVYNTLTQHASLSQAAIKSSLRQQGIQFRSFWAANMIVAEIDAAEVEELAARPDVARIDSNSWKRRIDKSEKVLPEISSNLSPTSVEWGVTNINAPVVWSAGFTGQGIVVAGLDTGIRWSHDTIKSKYRGWNGSTADHNYNWFDAVHSGGGTCGANTTAPCDDNSHGTHTVGTMVGDDGAGNQVGVAPGAKWIGCRNMNQGNGTPATYAECFQFMIAPTDLAGNNPDPTRRPHILNNSWACPVSEGCITGAELETIVNSATAAGIFVVASAGNSGPGCSSISSPPATYTSAFSVGSVNISNQLASNSSRGPSLFYDPSLLKPNVSAPGVAVRSSTSISDTSFATISGTSMAGPHVAGVIALLWSAVPSLSRNIEATRSILQNTANPDVSLITPQTCGGVSSNQIPNNSFGYGRVDALAALNAAVPPIQVAGRVLSPAGQGIANAKIILTSSVGVGRATSTNSLGYFGFDTVGAIGGYVVNVNSRRFRFLARNVSSSSNDLSNLEFIGLE
jgi:serine protease AprX